jgi:16S rRNA (guanine527-N7)-methyltransferase
MQQNDTPLPYNVSRETFSLLSDYVTLLIKWQKSINLVSQNTSELWERHIKDSLQLAPLIENSEAKTVLDLGSGGGLPALVLAIALPDRQFHLVESDKKKAIFLQEAIRILGLSGNTTVSCLRIEALPLPVHADIITSRALASTDNLLGYASKILSPNAFCLFLKGKNWSNEITEAERNWRFTQEIIPSQTSAEGVILKISQIQSLTNHIAG